MSHRYGPTGAGTVLLDLGAQTGALVLYTPEDLAGAEIEISPDTPGTPRTHAAVRARPGPNGTRYAALYAGLPAGGYTLWREHDIPAGPVTITGGQVTSSHWCGRSAGEPEVDAGQRAPVGLGHVPDNALPQP